MNDRPLRSLLLLAALLSGCAAPPPPPADDPASYGPRLERYLTGCWVNPVDLPRAPWFLNSSSADENTAKLNSPGIDTTKVAVPAEALRLTFLPPHGPARHGEAWEEMRQWGNYLASGYAIAQLDLPGQPPLFQILDYELREGSRGDVRLTFDHGHTYWLSVQGERGLYLDTHEENPLYTLAAFPLRLRSRLPSHEHFGLLDDVDPPSGVPRQDEAAGPR